MALYNAALSLRPEGHTHRSMTLNNLAAAHVIRFKYYNDLHDLDRSITLHRAVVALRTEGHAERPISLINLANSLIIRFERDCQVGDLRETIALLRSAVLLSPEGNHHRYSSLSSLAGALQSQFEHEGSAEYLDESIALSRIAFALLPEGHPRRAATLNNLATSLLTRFLHGGIVEDLDESIVSYRANLAFRTEGSPDRCSALINLAGSLFIRHKQCGSIADIDESIALYRTALTLRSQGHPDHYTTQTSLASALLSRFKRGGRDEDLDDAIALSRGAITFYPDGHLHRPTSLNNLACSLLIRFENFDRVQDLNEAISLHRAVLDICHKDHPLRPTTMNNLAKSLRALFERSHRPEDLNESIALYRKVLILRGEGHPDRAMSLINLACSLVTRFDGHGNGNVEDLEEAIVLNRSALAICPGGHYRLPVIMNNLASSLWRRFGTHDGKCGEVADLDESIALFRSAVALRPEGHHNRSRTLFGLGNALYSRFQVKGDADDLENSIQSLIQAFTHAFSGSLIRLDAAKRWSTLARSHNHCATLDAYRSAMMLQQRTLAIRPTLAMQHEFLNSNANFRKLALEAASYAIEKGDLKTAIEFLEQGRALLWSQMRGLRAPLDRLSEVDKALADRFKDISLRLETLTTSRESHSLDSDAVSGGYAGSQGNEFDEMLVQMRRLSQEQENIIVEIRKVPGFEDFLATTPFETLKQVASEGPVIIINHCKFRCDALIILSHGNVPCHCVQLDEYWYDDSSFMCFQLSVARREFGLHSIKYDKILRQVMKELWDRIVSKVVQKLKELGISEGSRIWWCPTSVLSGLPFHAAGPYQDAYGRTRHLLDDYISSYIPTLKSLIDARSRQPSGSQRLLFVGDPSLPSAKKEYDAIRTCRRIDKLLQGEQASCEAVMSELQNANWVHFTCHGLLNAEPFRSSLKLSDGGLTLLDIARAQLPDAEFAFLSACHTAEQHSGSAHDEVLHLAAAMQFCGFRSVIGTMWKLLDRDGPILARAVYTCLMRDREDREFIFKGAAAAVREAALHLRSPEDVAKNGKSKGIKTERWVNLVHIGA